MVAKSIGWFQELFHALDTLSGLHVLHELVFLGHEAFALLRKQRVLGCMEAMLVVVWLPASRLAHRVIITDLLIEHGEHRRAMGRHHLPRLDVNLRVK